jgi:threonine/homoserine/homoserine lactone efflux protein
MAAEIAAFSLAALVITLTPGADMALVARRAVADRWHTAARTSLGVVSGLVVHAAAAAIGVSAILAHSAAAFTVLKFIWAWLVSRARGVFLRPRWRAAMERVTGTIFLAFGVRLATLSR